MEEVQQPCVPLPPGDPAVPVGGGHAGRRRLSQQVRVSVTQREQEHETNGVQLTHTRKSNNAQRKDNQWGCSMITWRHFVLHKNILKCYII